MKQWVLGLAFNYNGTEILLLKKNRGPQFNVGRWNGFGGSVENETSLEAMNRESLEEVGLEKLDWVEVTTLKTCSGDVHIFACYQDAIYKAKQMEDEEIKIFKLTELKNTAVNLSWLIPMAINVLEKRENAKSFVIEEVY